VVDQLVGVEMVVLVARPAAAMAEQETLEI
jgi:hypothetical protein